MLPPDTDRRDVQGGAGEGIEEAHGVSPASMPTTRDFRADLSQPFPAIVISAIFHTSLLSRLRHPLASDRKHTINTVSTLDFLRDLVSAIPDPVVSEPKPSSSRPRRNTIDADPSAPKRKRTRKVKSGGAGEGEAEGEAEGEEAEPAGLPDIGTWKKDMSGAGGTGENGAGLYDNYEDEDDY